MRKIAIISLMVLILFSLPFCGKPRGKNLPVSLKVTFEPPQLRDAYIVKMKYTWKPEEGFSLHDNYWIYVHFWDGKAKTMYLLDDHKPPVPFSQWKPGEEISYERILVFPEYVEEISGDNFKVDFSVGFVNPETGQKIEVIKKPLSIKINSEMLPQKIYARGWYNEEADNSGKTWRWMAKTAICRVENPRKTSLLYIKGFFPEKYLPDQRIRIFINDHLLGEITQPQFQRLFTITPELMGDGDEFILRFEADKSFVPAQVSKGSPDKRELAAAFYQVFFCVK